MAKGVGLQCIVKYNKYLYQNSYSMLYTKDMVDASILAHERGNLIFHSCYLHTTDIIKQIKRVTIG